MYMNTHIFHTDLPNINGLLISDLSSSEVAFVRVENLLLNRQSTRTAESQVNYGTDLDIQRIVLHGMMMIAFIITLGEIM